MEIYIFLFIFFKKNSIYNSRLFLFMNDLKIIKNWEIRITRIANLQSVEFFSFIHKSDRLIIKKNSH